MDCSRAALAGPRVKGFYIEIKQIKLCAYTCLISVYSALVAPVRALILPAHALTEADVDEVFESVWNSAWIAREGFNCHGFLGGGLGGDGFCRLVVG